MTPDSAGRRYLPPDGGWGWMVCLAFALNNLIVYPLVSVFGLIFQETFLQYGISSMATSFILNAHQVFGMLFSIFNRRLLKRYGSRKMATTGGILIFIGIMLTIEANSVASLIVTYSIMTSIGLSLAMASFCFGIHCYFNSKRNKAMYMAMLLTAVGSIIMPQLINFLMSFYDTKWTIAIMGAISLHAFVSAMILRPIKWYRKPTSPLLNERGDTPSSRSQSTNEYEMHDMSRSVEFLREGTDDFLTADEANKVLSKSLNKEQSKSQADAPEQGAPQPTRFKWWLSNTIEVNLGSSIDIFNENPTINESPDNNNRFPKRERIFTIPVVENRTNKMTLKHQMDKIFSKDYFKDSLFINLVLGMTFEECAEVNFTLLTPFILRDLSMSMSEIANVLSVISASDLVYRFASPFIGEWCHKSPRVMYLMSLGMLIFTRTTFYFASAYESMLIVAVGLGIAKGVRSVYKNQVMPIYSKTEKKILTATNIQMVTNSIGLILSGPILGQIRDEYKSYNISIVLINILTGFTIILWTGEYIFMKILSRTTNN